MYTGTHTMGVTHTIDVHVQVHVYLWSHKQVGEGGGMRKLYRWGGDEEVVSDRSSTTPRPIH